MERSRENHEDHENAGGRNRRPFAQARHWFNPQSKVHYRPIEAAIRWSGLSKHETQIVTELQERTTPGFDDPPKWPELRLNLERIHDAIINKELPFGINGVTGSGEPPLNDPNLTVRHVDLKLWMKRNYPEQRPGFLFSGIERREYALSIETVQALALQREALKSQVEQRDQEIRLLRDLRTGPPKEEAPPIPAEKLDRALSSRSEMTYLHIVGGLLHLLLGRSPSGHAYSSFKTQESVISALVAHHGERLGITERTLQAKFADAKRRLSPG